MVFSASSTTSLLGQSGDSAYYLKRTLLFGAVGLLVMRVLSLRGARLVRPLTPLLLAASFFLLLAVLVPGIGMSANGAQRWIGAGLFQIQPSELAKLSLVLYGAHLLGRPPTDDARYPRPRALPVAGRARLPADGRRARPRHRHRRLPGHRRAARRRRGEDPPPDAACGRDRGGGAARDRDRALPDAAAHRVHPSRPATPAAPASRRSRRRSRSAPAGSSASASARACRRPSTCPRRTRT